MKLPRLILSILKQTQIGNPAEIARIPGYQGLLQGETKEKQKGSGNMKGVICEPLQAGANYSRYEILPDPFYPLSAAFAATVSRNC